MSRNEPGQCCNRCTKAGRTDYADRVRWHAAEARRYASLSTRWSIVALVMALIALTIHVFAAVAR